MLHISADSLDEKSGRRAVVLLGRQHAGETPSSFVIQSMV
jgi:hypothetical protein